MQRARKVIRFGRGSCFHLDAGRGRARCNVGGYLGEGGIKVYEAVARDAGLRRCRICWPAA